MNPTKILVAVGLGPHSEHAILQADERAKSSGAELLFCHTIPNALGGYPFFYRGPQKFDAQAGELRRRLQSELYAYVERLTGRKQGEYKVEIRQGRVHEVIVELAESWQADLIVLGVFGAAAGVGADRDVRRILRNSQVAVWIARPRTGNGRILVGTDFSDPALPAVAAAAGEAQQPGAALTILHSIEQVFPMPVWSDMRPGPVDVPVPVPDELRADVERRLADSLATFHVQGHCRVADGPAAAALLGAAAELRADLIVVGTLGRSGLPRMLLGSVAEEVALSATCCVLVVRLSEG